MHYLIVLILFGMSWNNVFARGLDISGENYIAQKLDSLEERVIRLETEMGAHQDEETLKRIDLEPNFYSIDSSNAEVGRPVETTNFSEELKKVEQKLEEEFEDQLAELASKYGDLLEKLSNIEKRVEENQRDKVIKGTEEIAKPESDDSEESEFGDRDLDELFKRLFANDETEADPDLLMF